MAGLLMAALVSPLGAQQAGGGSASSSGGFGGLAFRANPSSDNLALFMGGRGGWLINPSFSLGGAGFGLVTSVETDFTRENPGARLSGGYGGLELEYTPDPGGQFLPSVSLFLGFGGADYDGSAASPGTSNFFILEPGVHAGLGLTDYLRVSAGLLYRYTSGLDLPGYSDDDMRGVTLDFTLKFGSF